MRDLISRQAAIEALCKAGCKSEYCGISCDDVKAIEDLPSAQPEQVCIANVTLTDEQVNEAVEKAKNAVISVIKPEQRWITSGKPMNSGMYLVTLRQKFEGEEAYGVRIMRFINGNWMLPKHFPEWINEEIEQEVLAWRELPEPWKEGEA